MPVKALLHYARSCAAPPRPEEWRRQCRQLRSRLELLSDSTAEALRLAGVTLVRQRVSPDALPAADAVLIAAGCVSPPVPSVAGKRVFSPAEVLSLPEIPGALAVVGAGSAGMELAQVFARLGAAVTVYEQAGRILPGFPAEAARALESVCREMGIRFETGAAADIAALPQEHVLLTAGGRTPVFPPETERDNVLLLGDGGGRTATAYEAEREAEIAVSRLWGESVPPLTLVPRCVCGLYDLVAVGEESPLSAAAYSDGSGFAFLREEMAGYVRLFAREDGTLCGVHALLPGGAELSSLLSVLLRTGVSAETLSSTAFFHPSHAEIIRTAGRELDEILRERRA